MLRYGCVTPLSTIFQLYFCTLVLLVKETQRKPLICCMSLTNLSHKIVEYTLPWVGLEFTTLVVIYEAID